MDKEYRVFFNGFTWTCEIEDKKGEIVGHTIGTTPIEALEDALEKEGWTI